MLSAADIGVVAFRRSVMNGARALAKGEAPDAPRHAALYHRRSGSWFAPEDVPMTRVLEERFGDVRGLVPPLA